MLIRISFGVIVLVLATVSAQATESAVSTETHAAVEKTSGDERTNAYLERYRESQRALYDTLSGDSSPRVQVLAGHANLSEQDVATPSALRPKRADVIARAAQAASEDAFVQWMATSQGSFTSSQCGATVWPEAEVANLVRLEPDNAAAWLFAVALAAARGSQPAVDDALAQMASASIADDHFSDELTAWQRVYAAHPELVPSSGDPDEDEDESPQRSVLALALGEVGNRGNPAMSTLEEVCKPDAEQEITWQRAAWCADAATVFAHHGTSLALRGQGLKLLAIVGDRSPGIADLQRTQTWLLANSANPSENYRAMEDTDADRASDWRGDANDVVATARRLQRLGQPLTAPVGWVSPEDKQQSDERAARDSWHDYLRVLVDAMRGGGDPDQQAAAAVAESTMATIEAMSANQESGGGTEAPTGKDAQTGSASAAELTDLARSQPDRLLIQWLAATSGQVKGGSLAAAVANVQRLEPDNSAAWALSLAPSTDDTGAWGHTEAGSHFDSHTSALLRVWLDAVAAHPAPPEFAQSLQRTNGAALSRAESAAIATAETMAFSAGVGVAPLAVSRHCLRDGKIANEADRGPCIAVGRLMLQSATTLIDAMIGESIVRKLDAANETDEARAADIKKWRNASMSFDAEKLARFIREYVASGSEIEAMHNVADQGTRSTAPDASEAK